MQCKGLEGEDGFYSLRDKTIQNEHVDFSQFRGSVCLVVNTACKCKLAELGFNIIKRLREEYPELKILLYPTAFNRFVDQEMKTPAEILEEIRKRGVVPSNNTLVFEKRVLNSGEGLFHWLTTKSMGSGFFKIKALKWNFTMFVVGKDAAKVVRHDPMSLEYAGVSESVRALMNE
ncbi:phospholipid-hydroperoxide glutathione peroxidase [Nematocida major]|uniref:phospholipid-hydroperoxide glutathione peroxidase n=1 Tax=Nematocida major TaxID=1912982 RepID=UPI0020079E08|nr:phospholipid-hydroperoxide glutathione peroxidase [Nematocida major]KAH9386326.1 phospholipid-hydroperoxide glutathione peroxidase [Nematocida major]